MTENIMKPEMYVQMGAVGIALIMAFRMFLDFLAGKKSDKIFEKLAKCLEKVIENTNKLVVMQDTKDDMKELANEIRENNKLLEEEQTRRRIYDEQRSKRG
jgi:hypothetical protein